MDIVADDGVLQQNGASPLNFKSHADKNSRAGSIRAIEDKKIWAAELTASLTSQKAKWCFFLGHFLS